MSYNVQFTENTPSKPDITVDDQTLNQQTGVTFVGKNYPGYASYIAENFLHLLENFASPTKPSNPVQGQIWFDNSTSGNQLMVNLDGTPTGWSSTSGVKKTASIPTGAVTGDLWADTANQQLKMYNGSTWILVGPQFSEGLKTGPEIESITDLLDVVYPVITFWANGSRVAILSKNTFTPKITISGFTKVYQGFNLSSTDSNNTSNPIKFWGTSQQSDALLVAGTTVPSSNFLRTDKEGTSDVRINIRSNDGLQIGTDLSYVLRVDGSSAVVYNKSSGSPIDFRVTNQEGIATVLRIDSTTNVGINTLNPAEALDVSGNITTNGYISITGTTESSNLTTASLVTTGGVSITKSLRVGLDSYITGTLNLGTVSDTSSRSIIATAKNNLYDIGSEAFTFRNVYASNFYGNFAGTFSGTLAGNTVSGSANKLVSSTTFIITGDISSPGLTFNGQTENGTATFTTTISPNLIKNKDVLADPTTSSTLVSATDEILIFRPSLTGLKKTTKEKFLDGVATVPVGVIMPFAGSTPPTGYLLCDGSEVSKSKYSLLYSVIADTYKNGSLEGAGTFKLPDLRGRFALGKDNMDNNAPDIVTQESYGTTVEVYVDAGGGLANRVSDSAATLLGAGSGESTRTLDVTNLPQHQHDMKGRLSNGNAGNQYYAFRNASGTPNEVGASLDSGPSVSLAAQKLPNSGNIVSTSTVGQSINIMNPYLTINYIIYTGVIS